MDRALRRILYVEDEPDIRTIVRIALERVGGFEVTECASGLEALALAPTANADLVLLDVMMPIMDGMATLRGLRAFPATAATPVVFITAKVQPAEIARYKAAGAADVICKPFAPMDLPGAIRGIWDAIPA